MFENMPEYEINVNWFEFIFKTFEMLVSFSAWVMDFLFTPITFGNRSSSMHPINFFGGTFNNFIGMFGIDPINLGDAMVFTPFQLMSGLIGIFIIGMVVKAVVPGA